MSEGAHIKCGSSACVIAEYWTVSIGKARFSKLCCILGSVADPDLDLFSGQEFFVSTCFYYLNPEQFVSKFHV